MKYIQLLLLSIIFPSLLLSQNILIKDSHGAILNNSTYNASGTDVNSTVYAFAEVNNNTSSSMNLYCRKIIISSVTGTDNSFCWGGNCWPATQNTSGNYTTIAAGATSNEFIGDYTPNGYYGTTTVMYRFFSSPAGDSAEFTVVYDIPSGVNSLANNNLNLFTIYPNPANNYVVINYNNKNNSKATFHIYDCLGNIVKKITATSNNTTVNINGLTTGIYFCTYILNDKKVYSKKLIITH